MLVYRTGGAWLDGEELRRELMERIERAPQGNDNALAVLLRAGEFEAALADFGHAEAPQAMGLTDALTCHWLFPESPCGLRPWLAWLDRASLPSRLCLRRPEGYAYYALEWNLDAAHTEGLLREYERRTHDQVRRRPHPYLIAYTSLQLSCMLLALLTCEPSEQQRLTRAARDYQTALRGFVRRADR
jgi:hypothetical protein